MTFALKRTAIAVLMCMAVLSASAPPVSAQEIPAEYQSVLTEDRKD